MKTLPLLCAPCTRETLYLYLSASDHTVASVLIKEEDKRQLVYFVSKALHDAETRYPNVEKVDFSLVVATRRLRAYFESHSVVVYTNYPLK